ncbi:MAG TPA: hypothetical protein VKW08_03355 [Xanthobacteraceae bacterium]|nr:hypothetical protein [Xanthobacteraceae bacterium]
MSRAARRRRSGDPGELRKHLLGGALAVVALGLLAAGAYVYATVARPPTLDETSLCPVDGPRAVDVVLLDSTDEIPDAAKKEIRSALSDMAETLAPYELLEIRLLDAKTPDGRMIFSKCNPGDGSGLSEYTANPRLARQRWLEEFRSPLDSALDASFAPLPGKTSPIMETIQRIALERFTGRNVENVPKTLVLVSDMLQHGADYSQYTGDLSFDRFKASRAYKNVRTDLHGANVIIYYIQRKTAKPINSADHIRFWADWIHDNNGRLKEANKLQGVG